MDPDLDLAAALANLSRAGFTGDAAAITAAADLVDALDNPRPDFPLSAAALWYAEQGQPVFPLTPGTKVPTPWSHGCKDATTDPDRIRGWWRQYPQANIGLATGHLVDAVDIDGFVGQKSRAAMWDDVFAAIDADAVAKVLTPRPGGMHIYVPATGDGNSAGLCDGVDYRGVGGYVVAPPSKLPHATYRFLGTPDFTRAVRAGAA